MIYKPIEFIEENKLHEPSIAYCNQKVFNQMCKSKGIKRKRFFRIGNCKVICIKPSMILAA